MKIHKVINNQNIFDVAIQLYGSIEGVFDLMINNPNLSFDTILQPNQKFFWNENYTIHKHITNELIKQNIIPVNHERHVYYKSTDEDLRCSITIGYDRSNITLLMSGDGVMVVDWGDNSNLEEIKLTSTIEKYQHFFDNIVDKRTIRIYGNFNLKTWDLSPINGFVLPTMPLVVDEVISSNNKIFLDAFRLFDKTYHIKLTDMTLPGLAFIQDMNLSYLELQRIEYGTSTAIDDYLIYIATNHNQRRNCTVVLDQQPSGVYREPKKDLHGNYIITSGMEAIYVILHEPAWNAAGPWVFKIKDVEISADNLKLDYKLSFILE